MKKLTFICLAFMIATAGYGQNINSIVNKFKNESKVTYVSLNEELMPAELKAKGVERIDILLFDDCDTAVKEKYNQTVSTLKFTQFKNLLNLKNEGLNISIYFKEAGEKVSELVLFMTGDEPKLIRGVGAVNKAELDEALSGSMKEFSLDGITL